MAEFRTPFINASHVEDALRDLSTAKSLIARDACTKLAYEALELAENIAKFCAEHNNNPSRVNVRKDDVEQASLQIQKKQAPILYHRPFSRNPQPYDSIVCDADVIFECLLGYELQESRIELPFAYYVTEELYQKAFFAPIFRRLFAPTKQ